jgi:hypothetical protein
MAAYRLIPTAEMGSMWYRLAMFLQSSRFGHDYLLEAANHGIAAFRLNGWQGSFESLVELSLRAGQRTMSIASFTLANGFVNAAIGQSHAVLSSSSQTSSMLLMTYHKNSDTSTFVPWPCLPR